MRNSFKNLGWMAGVSAALLGAMFAVHGCGGDDEGDSGASGGGGSDAGGDVSQGGSAGTAGSGGGASGDAAIDVKADCELVGASCSNHSDCCSANCDPDTNVCTNPITPCKQAGEACSASTECCTTVCT